MKLIKLANGDGYVIMKFTTNGNGETLADIIGHEGGATCENSDDSALIDELLGMDIEGFGGSEVGVPVEKPDELINSVSPDTTIGYTPTGAKNKVDNKQTILPQEQSQTEQASW